MTTGTLMGLITVLMMLVFVGVVFWAYVLRDSSDFDQAARLPLQEDEPRHPDFAPRKHP